ncbi:hypothetical protein [Undibacterium danionis]|uniref:Uncharacterized protein n=1 Tax=Undibacterium danionis TaxID=1812100 RepID=A0ABV6IK36_9BURK
MTTIVTYPYSLSHTIHYNTRNPVPISEVIKALESLQALMKSVPTVIAGITETKIRTSELHVERIESGSLFETIVLTLFFKDEEDLKKFMEKIRENPKLKNTLIGIALAGLVGYGLHLASSSKGESPQIQANNNTIITIGADATKMAPEALKAIIEAAVTNKKENAKNAIKFVSPARSDPESSISMAGIDGPEIEITPKAILEAPKEVPEIANQKIEDMQNIDIQIRAYDLDNKNSGWAGKIEGVTSRTKIELDPHVDEKLLFGKTVVKADVTVTFITKPKDKHYTAKSIFIRKIY